MAAGFGRLLVVAKRSAHDVYVGLHNDAHLKSLLQEKSQVPLCNLAFFVAVCHMNDGFPVRL
jgi:hypothetical protein